jgi:hypothetical protein
MPRTAVIFKLFPLFHQLVGLYLRELSTTNAMKLSEFMTKAFSKKRGKRFLNGRL